MKGSGGRVDRVGPTIAWQVIRGVIEAWVLNLNELFNLIFIFTVITITSKPNNELINRRKFVSNHQYFP